MICNSHFYGSNMQELLDDIISEDDHLYIKRNRIFIGAVWVQLGFAILAVALGIDDIETIMGTGPIGSVIGLIVFGIAYKFEFSERKKIGLSAPLFSTICFSLVYFLNWSPGDAHIPIATLMVLYALWLFFIALKEIKKHRTKKIDWNEDLLDG